MGTFPGQCLGSCDSSEWDSWASSPDTARAAHFAQMPRGGKGRPKQKRAATQKKKTVVEDPQVEMLRAALQHINVDVSDSVARRVAGRFLYGDDPYKDMKQILEDAGEEKAAELIYDIMEVAQVKLSPPVSGEN